MLTAYPDKLKQSAKPLYDALTVDTAKQQAKLASLSSVLHGGEIQRGRDLFFGNKKAICATCHAVQGQGGRIGPDLSKIGAIRTSRDLLEAIVVPSASFARGYEAFVAATASGETYTGVITRETPDAVYLFSTDRVETRISRDELEALAQSPVSIMPEGMEAQLSRQELADLDRVFAVAEIAYRVHPAARHGRLMATYPNPRKDHPCTAACSTFVLTLVLAGSAAFASRPRQPR